METIGCGVGSKLNHHTCFAMLCWLQELGIRTFLMVLVDHDWVVDWPDGDETCLCLVICFRRFSPRHRSKVSSICLVCYLQDVGAEHRCKPHVDLLTSEWKLLHPNLGCVQSSL